MLSFLKAYCLCMLNIPKIFSCRKRKAVCPRYEPEVGERVPYVIISGEPNSTLISCVREPEEFIFNRRLKINFEYYVRRQVLPSLHRALNFIPLKIEWLCPTTVGCYKFVFHVIKIYYEWREERLYRALSLKTLMISKKCKHNSCNIFEKIEHFSRLNH